MHVNTVSTLFVQRSLIYIYTVHTVHTCIYTVCVENECG